MDASVAFFRLLAYLAAGGFIALALIPGGEVSRGFFRFSAALYAALVAAGLAIGWAGIAPWPARAAVCMALAAGVAVASGTKAEAQRAFLVFAATASGVATGLYGGAAGIASALLLGSVMTAMILGHWYLVMPNLPPDPLLRLTRLYAGSVLVRAIAVSAAVYLATATPRGLDRFLDSAGLMIWPRLLFGLVAPAVLALMALPTVKNRDTQPATGMLYVACVLVLVGEGIAQYIALKTSVPI